MKPKFYRKVLRNGFTVILEKRNLPVVSVAFAVRQGGIHEPEKEKGISHFIEHMLYKGTPSRNASQIAHEIEKNGGELNGFTDEAVTAFWCKMPAKHLGLALNVLSDMVKNPLFDEKELEKERRVIFEEMKMYQDNPRLHVITEIQKYIYKGTLAIPLIGTEKTMNSITKEKILKKFQNVYKPNNMVLVVVGDADFDELCKFIEKNFGNEKGKVTKQTISPTTKKKIETRKGIDQANLIFAYHVPLSTNKLSYAAEVLNALMAGGMSSRLFSEIREKRNLAYGVKGSSDINRNYAHNLIYVGTKKENVGLVRGLILKEFEKVSKSLTDKELNEVKEQLIGQFHISMEDSQAQLVNLLGHEIDGNAKEFYEFEKKIKAVKLKDVKKLASAVKENNYGFFALVPT